MARNKKRFKKNKQELANSLNRNMPASEVWFWNEWKAIEMDHVHDRPNLVCFGFIPDLINMHYRYIVEIDGGIHSKKSVQHRDNLKNKVFSRRGFSVFRIEAYNYEHLGILADEIMKIRAPIDKYYTAKNSRTILIRRMRNGLMVDLERKVISNCQLLIKDR